MVRVFGLLIFALSLLADKMLVPSILKERLHSDNPYVAEILLQSRSKEELGRFYLGAFDPKLKGVYEKKEYPLSRSLYEEIGIDKSFQSGLKLKASYRKATGVQETNNIKTSRDGEYLVGIDLPLIQMLKKINPKKYELIRARLWAKEARYEAKERLQKLYRTVLEAYYDVLYATKLLKLRTKLLQSVEEMRRMVEKKIAVGARPKIEAVEMDLVLAGYQAKVQEAKELKGKKEAELKSYVDIDPARYRMPPLPKPKELPSFLDAFNIAKSQRPELRRLDMAIRLKRMERTLNTLRKLPSLRFYLYGVYDRIYEEGAKGGVELTMPLQRNAYEGKRRSLLKEIAALEARRKAFVRTLEKSVSNAILRQKSLQRLYAFKTRELEAARKLMDAQMKKFLVGEGTLFMLLQRQKRVIQIQEELLGLKRERSMADLNLAYTMGSSLL